MGEANQISFYGGLLVNFLSPQKNRHSIGAAVIYSGSLKPKSYAFGSLSFDIQSNDGVTPREMRTLSLFGSTT